MDQLEDSKISSTSKVKEIWGNTCYVHGKRTNARGVAILFNNNFEYEVLETKIDSDGNYICLTLKISDWTLNIMTIYAPNNDSPELCPPPWGVDILFLLFPPSDVRRPMSDVRRPMSGVTHGFRSFKGKVLELLSPNLVCRLIGSVACLGLLLAVVPLLLTE